MRIPHHSRCRKLTAALAIATAVVTVAVAVGAASAATKAVVAVGPHFAADDVSAWQFPVPNWKHSNKEEGRVDDVLQIGGTVFVGGNFTATADHSGDTARRTYLASESVSTGSLTSWSPTLNGRVYALAASPDNTLLYVGGSFTQVNGQPYQHLVAFDLSTGQISPSFRPRRSAARSRPSRRWALTSTSAEPSARWAVSPTSAWPSSAPTTAAGWRSTRAGPQAPTPTCATSAEIRPPVVCSPPGGSTASTARRARCTWRRSRPAPAQPCRGQPPDLSDPRHRPFGTRLYAAMAGPGGTALAYDAGSGSRLWYYMTDGNVRRSPPSTAGRCSGCTATTSPRGSTRSSPSTARAPASRGTRCSCCLPTGAAAWAPALETDQGVLGVWSLDGSSGTLEVGGDFTKVDGSPQARFAIFPLVG